MDHMPLFDPDHEAIGSLFKQYARALDGSPLPRDARPLHCVCSKKRWEFIEHFSFAIPSEEALAAIAKLSPLVEIGAGTGFWAALLARRGVDIVCTGERDADEPYTQTVGRYHPVKAVGDVGLAYLRDRNAFTCWPPYDDDLAYRVALRLRPGRYLAYIGESYGGCTGDDQFHEYVKDAFEMVEEIEIPQWGGLHDYLWIYKKRLDRGWG